jgi:hypothetical protein
MGGIELGTSFDHSQALPVTKRGPEFNPPWKTFFLIFFLYLIHFKNQLNKHRLLIS